MNFFSFRQSFDFDVGQFITHTGVDHFFSQQHLQASIIVNIAIVSDKF